MHHRQATFTPERQPRARAGWKPKPTPRSSTAPAPALRAALIASDGRSAANSPPPVGGTAASASMAPRWKRVTSVRRRGDVPVASAARRRNDGPAPKLSIAERAGLEQNASIEHGADSSVSRQGSTTLEFGRPEDQPRDARGNRRRHDRRRTRRRVEPLASVERRPVRDAKPKSAATSPSLAAPGSPSVAARSASFPGRSGSSSSGVRRAIVSATSRSGRKSGARAASAPSADVGADPPAREARSSRHTSDASGSERQAEVHPREQRAAGHPGLGAVAETGRRRAGVERLPHASDPLDGTARILDAGPAGAQCRGHDLERRLDLAVAPRRSRTPATRPARAPSRADRRHLP